MRRILLRTGMSPLEHISTANIIRDNLIGENTGNLIYAHSLFRTLTLDKDTEIVPDRYRLNQNDAAYINENFDAYIIPLADMFRNGHSNEMNRVKNLVKKLDIPCVVVGVGLRAGSEKDIKNGFAFDDEARSFIEAVLEKSALIGIRGELTAKYLEHLGFSADRDFMVIGCPSMYAFGNELKRKPLSITPESLISVNSSIVSSQSTIDFLGSVLENYKNSVYIPQRIGELKTLYLGADYEHETKRNGYPDKITDPVYAQNRAKIFLQAKQWIDFLGTADLSIGSRLHGNVAAILAGAPAVIIPHGTRMKELVDYHRLPSISADRLKKCRNLEEVLENVDFDSMFKAHRENFERYKKFMKTNGIETIFDSYKSAPLDELLSALGGDFEVKSAALLSKDELVTRWNEVYESQLELISELREEKSELNRELRAQNVTSIRKDIKLLSLKIGDKIRGEKRKNIERITELRK